MEILFPDLYYLFKCNGTEWFFRVENLFKESYQMLLLFWMFNYWLPKITAFIHWNLPRKLKLAFEQMRACVLKPTVFWPEPLQVRRSPTARPRAVGRLAPLPRLTRGAELWTAWSPRAHSQSRRSELSHFFLTLLARTATLCRYHFITTASAGDRRTRSPGDISMGSRLHWTK